MCIAMCASAVAGSARSCSHEGRLRGRRARQSRFRDQASSRGLRTSVAASTSLTYFAISRPSRTSGGRIAQLVEQLTLNQRVAGSSPAAPTNQINGLAKNGFIRPRPNTHRVPTARDFAGQRPPHQRRQYCGSAQPFDRSRSVSRAATSAGISRPPGRARCPAQPPQPGYSTHPRSADSRARR